jgi:hypothetical protein
MVRNAWNATPASGVSYSYYDNGNLIDRLVTTNYVAFGDGNGNGYITGNFNGLKMTRTFGNGNATQYGVGPGNSEFDGLMYQIPSGTYDIVASMNGGVAGPNPFNEFLSRIRSIFISLGIVEGPGKTNRQVQELQNYVLIIGSTQFIILGDNSVGKVFEDFGSKYDPNKRTVTIDITELKDLLNAMRGITPEILGKNGGILETLKYVTERSGDINDMGRLNSEFFRVYNDGSIQLGDTLYTIYNGIWYNNPNKNGTWNEYKKRSN